MAKASDGRPTAVATSVEHVLPDYKDSLRSLEIASYRQNNPAQYMHERMVERINHQQDHLPPDYELGVQVVGGAAPPFHLRQIAFSNPNILIFSGVDSAGSPVELIQHYTQMSIHLVAVKKIDKEPYRIGFT